MATLACLLTTALGLSIVGAKQNSEDNDQALKLVRSGLDLLAEGKIEEGLGKLELANKKSPQVCEKMTRGWWDGEEASWKGDNLTAERALKRLQGIKFIRPEENWVFAEENLLRKEISRLAPTIENTEKQLKPVGDSYERQLSPWSHSFPGGVVGVGDALPAEGELAKNLWERNRKDEAIVHVDRLVALFPWNDSVREVAMRMYKAQKQNSKIQALEFKKLTPAEVKSLTDSFQPYDDSTNHVKCDALNQVLKNHPWCTLALVIRSQNYLKENHPKKAIDDANQILAMHPGLAEGHVLRAKAYEMLKLNQKALDDYNAVRRTMPLSDECRGFREAVCERLKLAHEVLKIKDAEIRLNPHHIKLYKDKADFLRRGNKLKESEKVLDEAIPLAERQHRAQRLIEGADYEYAPSKLILAELMTDKAQIRSWLHDTKGAINVVNKLIAKNPQDLKLLELKTKFLVDAGQYDLGLATINEAIARQDGPITMPSLWGIKLPGTAGDGSSWKALPPGCSVNHDAISRLETKIQIYQKMQNRDAELKARLQKLTLQRLELTDIDPDYLYFETILAAIDISERDIAFDLVDRVCKNTTHRKSLDVESFCALIYETKNPALAIEVLDKLQKNSKTQVPSERFEQARTALLALQASNR
jgi:tetratricopeptide (TPR) repeat protein